MAKRGTRMTVGGLLGGVATVVITSVVLVQSGIYAPFAQAFGLPVLTSITQLMPGADSMNKNDLGLNLGRPQSTTPKNDEAQDSQPGEGDTATQQATPGTDNTLPSAAYAPISIQDALTTTENTQTATPHPKGYDRTNEFGGWADSSQLCGYGTTRDYILKRDMTNVSMDSQCKVQSGTLTDPYTGKTIRFQRDQYRKVNGKTRKVSGDSTAVQIDHVVALNDAWASGLWKTDRKADRVKYANDPDVLLASQGEANNEKSMGVNLYAKGVPSSLKPKWKDSTPSVWLPSNKPYQCAYMAKRVYIKHKYGLTMSTWEKQETVSLLRQCVAG